MDIYTILHAIDGAKRDGTESYILRNGRYLSGIPYLWSDFGERAYIFPSKACADGLIVMFPDELAGATVHQRFPEGDTP